MATKQVVFVQGEKKNEAAYPWMFFHLDPFKDVDPGDVQLVYFDYPDGKRKTWHRWDKKRGTSPPPAPDEEVVLDPMVNMRMSDGKLGPLRPSVLALYQFIKDQPKESILSLQVFSHGWMGGPVLWNSYEFGPKGEAIEANRFLDRDPNDTDFRIRDFFGNNPLADAEGRKFAAAFAPGALIKLWGCVAPDGLRAPVQRYKIGATKLPDRAANKVLLQTYTDALVGCFALLMAYRLQIPVWAAPLGWGSDATSTVPISYSGAVAKNLNVTYRKTFPPDLRKDQWWRVSWFFRNQDRGVQFYEQILGARVDAVDFVEFTKDWFDKALAKGWESVEAAPIGSPRELQQRLLDRVAGIGTGLGMGGGGGA